MALTITGKLPTAVGQPVISPSGLMEMPGGRPAAENETLLLDTGPAGVIWRLTLLPASVAWGPGSISGMAAGFIWSRSVLPGALIPLTVPALEYCQNA